MRLLLFCSLILTIIHVARCQPDAGRPNILWIVSEDNSPLIGAYGDEFATTPNIDRFAAEGIRYTNAFATAPVCAPSRSTLITGMYPPSVGTEHMRSTYPVPAFVKFFPHYLRQAGYYTTNNAKKDYNTIDQPECWDESSQKATYRNRKPGQPFFAVFNIAISHESSLHTSIPDNKLRHDPEKVPLPPYHPATKEMKHDWAQYYDKIQSMDEQVGRILRELDESGLSDSTIVFYYSDHGGVLGRSKRFLYESGLHVPLIIRFPEMYKHMAPGDAGSTTDRIVTFLDFAPTILSLAGLQPPGYMQGAAFLGPSQKPPHEYAHAFRGRMDERPDMSRSVRDKRFRYIRNFLPHKIYGQYLEYLWKAPSMASWERAWKKGELNDTQSAFWKRKPAEELYDVKADPHNINNLAGNAEYKQVLERMRAENQRWMLESRDLGFIPEPLMAEISNNTQLYDYARSDTYALKSILGTALLASSGNPSDLREITTKLEHTDALVRYWAVTGCIVLSNHASPYKPKLKALLRDNEPVVRIAAAEALYLLGEKDLALKTLAEALQSENLMLRVYALNVLEEMGEDARPALAGISSLLRDKVADGDYDVRAAKRIADLLEKH